MKGYKTLNQNMGVFEKDYMEFELGKTYSINEKVVLQEKGFRFCEKIENLNYHYSDNITENRVFEVEAEGDMESDGIDFWAQQIRLVRELTRKEIDDYFRENYEDLIKSDNYFVRRTVAQQGLALETLIHDEHPLVRREVALQGFGLETLIHDEDKHVRRAVAQQGFGLDILVLDKSEDVRATVAYQGYKLDKLISDENCCVRRAVAAQGYGLDKLISDESWLVRIEVARNGYGLDKLISDENWFVSSEARQFIENIDYYMDALLGKAAIATEIDMLKLMKESGVSEKQIRNIAKKKEISMKIVDKILNSSETKKGDSSLKEEN